MALIRRLVLAAAVVWVAGCSNTSSLKELRVARTDVRVATMTVAEEPSTALDPQLTKVFGERLSKKLRQHFVEGHEITAHYKVVTFNPGSRFMRYMVGMGAGKGTASIRVNFVDGAGQSIGVIDVEGNIVMGTFGGSSKIAIEEAADEAAEYAIKSFAKKRQRKRAR